MSQPQNDSPGAPDSPQDKRSLRSAVTGPEPEPPKLRTDLLPGLLIGGQFTLVSRLGAGGMGEAWLARDSGLGHGEVVLKFLPRDLDEGQFEGELKRVQDNFRTVKDLTHPHICPIIALPQSPAPGLGYYLVMKYCPGGTLRDLRDRHRAGYGMSLPLEEVVRHLRPIAEALDYAHRKKVIHRDVKPSNIVFAGDGDPVLIDFGLATRQHGEASRRNVSLNIAGTPGFMSPEQKSGETQEIQMDQYSLAMTAYDLVCESPKPNAGHLHLLEHSIRRDKPQLQARLPDSAGRALLRALRMNPDSRFATCVEFIEALTKQSAPPPSSTYTTYTTHTPPPPPTAEEIRIQREQAETAQREAAAQLAAAAQREAAARLQRELAAQRTAEQARERESARAAAREARRAWFADHRALMIGVFLCVLTAFAMVSLVRWLDSSPQVSVAPSADPALVPEPVATEEPVAAVPPPAPIPAPPAPVVTPPPPPSSVGWVGTKAGDRKVVKIKGVDYALRWCPSGSFQMGSPSSETGRDGGETQHSVTLTQGFWMLETEVTQEQWESLMGVSIEEQAKKGTYGQSLYGVGNRYPMYYVSWDDCHDYLRKLNAELKVSGMEFSLPTEAEWEYACRAGTTGAYAGDLDAMAWYGSNSGSRTHEVGSKNPNPWGLQDMHGNVWEWCEDWYGGYPSGSVTDPVGPNSGALRVSRGGSWSHVAAHCRSAIRIYYDPSVRISDLGLRPVVRQVR